MQEQERRFKRGVGRSSMALLPPDPGSRRQMDRPQSLPEGQRGHGAKGRGQPSPTELTRMKKKNIKKTPPNK